MANFIKVGDGAINLDQITHFTWDIDSRSEVEVHFAAPLSTGSQVITFEDNEAELLRAWIEKTATDIADEQGRTVRSYGFGPPS
jgi:hypothetical protein